MRLARYALVLLLALSSAPGCRAIHDDQETRPLPAPEPPPAAPAPERGAAREPEAPRKAASRPRPEPASDEPRATEPASEPPSSPAEETLDAGSTAPAVPAPAPTRCLDQCRNALETCVVSADGGASLETCRGAFESCKAGCG